MTSRLTDEEIDRIGIDLGTDLIQIASAEVEHFHGHDQSMIISAATTVFCANMLARGVNRSSFQAAMGHIFENTLLLANRYADVMGQHKEDIENR